MDQQRICMQLESIRWKIEEEKNAMKAEASRVKKKKPNWMSLRSLVIGTFAAEMRKILFISILIDVNN